MPAQGLCFASIGYVPDNASALEWFEALVEMIKTVAPRLVVPCDGTSFRLLAMLAIDPPRSMRQKWREQVAALVKNSREARPNAGRAPH